MKCPSEKVRGFVERPDLSLSAALIYGADPILVSENRRRLQRGALGEQAGDDLYLLTLDPSAVQRDAGLVHAALTSRSLLPGRQVALLEPATNAHTGSIARALEDPDPDDAFLIVVAGDLKTQSTLRKLFESASKAIALPSEAVQPTPQDLRRRFGDRKLPPPTQDALARLTTLAGEMSWGEFESLFEKLAIYLQGRTDETLLADVDACAPLDRTVQVDEIVDAVATGDHREIARLFRALADKGTDPVAIVISVTLQFLQMHRAVASAQGPRGIRSALYRQPMHPSRRQALDEHCRHWSASHLEAAIRELHTADFALRASNTRAPRAVLERALMRIAGGAPRGIRTAAATRRQKTQ